MVPEILAALAVAEGCYRARGYEVVVTSCGDSTHKKGSLHYKDPEGHVRAVDIRTKNIQTIVVEGKPLLRDQVLRGITAELKGQLDAEFDIILEDLSGPNEHLHVEFQPK